MATTPCSESVIPGSGFRSACCRTYSTCSCKAISRWSVQKAVWESDSPWCNGWCTCTEARWRRKARVIRILKQICGSLYEAHTQGLVHRDIKPANIMLNRRGGEPDVVKVLDFGLVRALDEAKQSRQSGGLAGTPLYMSPEAIQTPDLVDARSDIYALGAVGYFLVTGQPVFSATSLVELCQQHATALADAPSQRLGRPVSPELESALLACLEKTRAKRPQTARDLAALLDRVLTAGNWSLDEAEAWWGRHERAKASAASAAPAANQAGISSSNASAAGGTATSGFDQTLASGHGG